MQIWQPKSGAACTAVKLPLLTRSALQYISLHATKGLQYDVAEELHVSTSHLSSIIRKETGITFNEHLTEGKMTVARAMLSDPRVLVEEIAYAVGYKNYISFYNAFKRTQHMTPTEYRNKLLVMRTWRNLLFVLKWCWFFQRR